MPGGEIKLFGELGDSVDVESYVSFDIEVGILPNSLIL